MTADKLEEALLDHLLIEFPEHGRKAVEFLRSGQAVLTEPPDDVPRAANIVAYCLRAAMEAILESQADEIVGGTWRARSRAVVAAKTRFGLAKNKPGEDSAAALEDLLDRIDEMEQVHRDGKLHEKRLLAVIAYRTGAQPITHGANPIQDFQALLERLNKVVHPGSRVVEMDAARKLWAEGVAVLRQLFLPPEVRNRKLEELAACNNPDAADVSALVPLLASPNHLQRFLGLITTPAWLAALVDTGLLDPPSDSAGWPVYIAIGQLKDRHANDVTNLLRKLMSRCGSDAAAATHIVRAAREVGQEGHSVVYTALRKHRSNPAIVDMAIDAMADCEPTDRFVEQVADIVFTDAVPTGEILYPDPLVRAYIDGTTPENSDARISLLCYKLRAISEYDGGRSYFLLVGSNGCLDQKIPDYRGRELFSLLLSTLVKTLQKAIHWASVNDLLSSMSALPEDLSDRVCTWLLAVAKYVQHEAQIYHIAKAVKLRHPTGDDLRLIDRVMAECDPTQYMFDWTSAVGDPPTVLDVTVALKSGDVPSLWRAMLGWRALLPDSATASWSTVLEVLAAKYGQPSRAAFEQFPELVTTDWGQSPISVAGLRAKPRDDAARWIAAWRPTLTDWLVSARELARTLEAIVKADVAVWAAEPVVTASLLRHPTYIHHYLLGLANAESLAGIDPNGFLDLIQLVYAEPWEIVALGDPRFDFDSSWRPAQRAGIALIKSLADSDVGFDHRRDEVWSILHAAVEAHDESSALIGESFDPLESAINRPCTQALEAMLAFLAHEQRNGIALRPDALELFATLLRLEGRNGAEHRAILVSRMGFLLHIAPDWVEQQRDQLFGSAAPGALGQISIDLAIRWGQPNRWLLENYPIAVKDAVKRGSENALQYYIVATLRGVPGYTIDNAFNFLKANDLMSEAAQSISMLLQGDDAPPELVQQAVQFWKLALAAKSPDALVGFGFFAEIEGIDNETWIELTLQTVVLTKGKLEVQSRVAERIGEQAITAATLEILDHLVRGANKHWVARAAATLAEQVFQCAGHLSETKEYVRLQTTLSERGLL